MDQFEPSKKEIYHEMWNGFKDSFKPSKEINVAFKNFCGFTAGVSMYLNVTPYAIPTSRRNFKETEPYENSALTTAEAIGGFTGIGIGALGWVGQISAYAYAARHDYPEVLLLPVATNFLSGIYEIGRHSYNNAKDRVNRKRKTNAELIEKKMIESRKEISDLLYK